MATLPAGNRGQRCLAQGLLSRRRMKRLAPLDLSSTRWRRLSAVLVILAACRNGGAPAEDDGGVDGGGDADLASDGDVPSDGDGSITGVGDSCGGGCAGATVCTTPSTDCEHGYCLFDGRTFEAYCTLDCTSSPCPPAYHCEAVELVTSHACVADPAVCGDGVVERGEACDDGNTESGDGCLGDCSGLDTPIDEMSHIEATFTWSGEYTSNAGGEPIAFSAPATLNTYVEGSGDEWQCNTALGSYPDSAPTHTWVQYTLHPCEGAEGLGAIFYLGVPFAEGEHAEVDGVEPLSCARLQLPPPDDALLAFCPVPGSTLLEITDVSAEGVVTGTLSATLDYQEDEGIGGCDGSYSPPTCPAVRPPEVALTGTFTITNVPVD